MMYTLNKIIGYLISPVGFSIALVAAAVLARVLGRRRIAGGAVLLALVNVWLWSTPLMSRWMGVALEREFLVDGRVPAVESLPTADFIELHGGGMSVATNVSPYAEMWTGADRVWHAARLWKAGKAPKILVTSPKSDLSSGPLLADLGVPKEAIVYELEARNTEEEAKAVARMLDCPTVRKEGTHRPKVLVVTSAWHMRRTLLMYEKYAPGVEAIPAPCDWENTLKITSGWMLLLPDADAFRINSYAFHEWVGHLGYRFFR